MTGVCSYVNGTIGRPMECSPLNTVVDVMLLHLTQCATRWFGEPI